MNGISATVTFSFGSKLPSKFLASFATECYGTVHVRLCPQSGAEADIAARLKLANRRHSGWEHDNRFGL